MNQTIQQFCGEQFAQELTDRIEAQAAHMRRANEISDFVTIEKPDLYAVICMNQSGISAVIKATVQVNKQNHQWYGLYVC